jgi:hypothetical protein
MTRSTTQLDPAASDAIATKLSNLITSMSVVNVDPNGTAGVMCDLSNQLAKSSLDPTPLNYRVAYYYALYLAEIPWGFRALSVEELADPLVRSVLAQYRHWFDAEDTEILFDDVPSDAWVLDTVSRAMVYVIVSRAKSGDARMPACSPQDHPCSPFWSRPNV